MISVLAAVHCKPFSEWKLSAYMTHAPITLIIAAAMVLIDTSIIVKFCRWEYGGVGFRVGWGGLGVEVVRDAIIPVKY